MVRPLCFMLFALALGACAGLPDPVGPPEADVPAPAPTHTLGPAHYSGVAILTGRRLFAVLDTRFSGEVVVAGLEIPALSLTASGAGRWRGSRLHVDFAYSAPCPGTVTVRVERGEDRTLSGTLSARDCTGEAQGSLELAPAVAEGRRPGTR